MTEARDFLKLHKKKLIVVYLPMRQPHVLKNEFLGVFHSLDLQVINLDQSFRDPEDLFAKRGGHYSIDGNRRVAEALDYALTKLGRSITSAP